MEQHLTALCISHEAQSEIFRLLRQDTSLSESNSAVIIHSVVYQVVYWVFLARFMRSPHEYGLGDHGNGTAHKHPWTKSRKTVNRAGIPGCQLLSALGNRAGDRQDRHICIPGTYGHLSGIQALKLQPGTYPTRMARGPARPTLWGPICPRAGPSIGTPGEKRLCYRLSG
jgi:hypothetical protein